MNIEKWVRFLVHGELIDTHIEKVEVTVADVQRTSLGDIIRDTKGNAWFTQEHPFAQPGMRLTMSYERKEVDSRAHKLLRFRRLSGILFATSLFLVVSYILLATLYGVVVAPKIEAFHRELTIKRIRAESTPEWYEEKEKRLKWLREAVEKQAMLLEHDQKYLQQNSRLTKQQIYDALADRRRGFIDLNNTYQTEVKSFNTAVMRYCHGVQYKGVEETLISNSYLSF